MHNLQYALIAIIVVIVIILAYMMWKDSTAAPKKKQSSRFLTHSGVPSHVLDSRPMDECSYLARGSRIYDGQKVFGRPFAHLAHCA